MLIIETICSTIFILTCSTNGFRTKKKWSSFRLLFKCTPKKPFWVAVSIVSIITSLDCAPDSLTLTLSLLPDLSTFLLYSSPGSPEPAASSPQAAWQLPNSLCSLVPGSFSCPACTGGAEQGSALETALGSACGFLRHWRLGCRAGRPRESHKMK